jgi:flagellar biosynthesis protein FlhF
MKIKRFFAQDMRQAIRQVRAEQGPDAVILSTRSVDGGIEIISAIDYDQNLLCEMVGASASPAPARETPGAGVAQAHESKEQSSEAAVPPPSHTHRVAQSRTGHTAPREPVCGPDQDAALLRMQRELNSIRGLLQDQLSRLAWADYSRAQPLKAGLIRRLRGMGFGPEQAAQIAGGVRESRDPHRAWREVLFGIAKRIPVTEDDILSQGGIVALVGPTGVGKTTTVAKLAARFSLRQGRHEVAMVSTDSQRIGAHRQLQTYGQILGVPVVQVASGELVETLHGLADKRLVLIDTSGMSPRDARLRTQLRALSDGSAIRVYLTLAANIQGCAREEVVGAFGVVGLKGCVLTKLDEAVSLGEALTVIMRHRLALAYVSTGQRVPEDLKPARISDLVSRTLSLAKKYEQAVDEEHAMSWTAPLSTTEVAANAHA